MYVYFYVHVRTHMEMRPNYGISLICWTLILCTHVHVPMYIYVVHDVCVATYILCTVSPESHCMYTVIYVVTLNVCMSN